MNTRKNSVIVIVLLSTFTMLSGCGDKPEEAPNATSPAIVENIPVTPPAAAVNNTPPIAVPAVDTTTANTYVPPAAASDAKTVVKVSSEQVRKIQQALLDAGYDPGTVDGKSGRKTRAALRSFQQQKNLTVGQFTKETLQALGVAE